MRQVIILSVLLAMLGGCAWGGQHRKLKQEEQSLQAVIDDPETTADDKEKAEVRLVEVRKEIKDLEDKMDTAGDVSGVLKALLILGGSLAGVGGAAVVATKVVDKLTPKKEA
jgi:hypothetical protein